MADGDGAQQPRIQSVARAAQILSAVAASDHGLSAREIAEQVGLRLPTTYHLLHTLSAVGLLRREASTSRYVIGFAVGALASGLERQVSMPEQLHRCVREVAAQTGEAVYGSGWSDGEIVVFARAAGTQPVSVAEVPLGLAAHAHARASGKLLLALASEEERARYLERHPPTPRTRNTLSRRALLRQLAEVRERGYAVEEEEFAEGICCVAAPYTIGAQTFGVVISAPAERFRARFDSYLDALLAATRAPLFS